jgi:hypothetical protein
MSSRDVRMPFTGPSVSQAAARCLGRASSRAGQPAVSGEGVAEVLLGRRRR